jgi:hypothetical protein
MSGASLHDGCGEPQRTPVAIANRPGLSQISYRCGAHASFLNTMLARLSSRTGLHAGEPSDFSVAFLDSVAAMSDVLTFYQERIANESYLRTATERRSALELARLIGYLPRPGVAAGAYLAFTLEDAPGAPEQGAAPMTLGARLKVQSLPKPGALPLTFETIEPIEARPEWNAMRVLRTQPQRLFATMSRVILNGASVDVSPGDTLLIAAESNKAQRVRAVTRDQKRGQTIVDLDTIHVNPPPFRFPIRARWPIQIFFANAPRLTNSFVSSNILSYQWRQHDLHALAKIHRWSLPALRTSFLRLSSPPPLPPEHGVFAFRQRAAIFGHNAPKYTSLTTDQKNAYSNWESRTLADDDSLGGLVHLDRTYSNVVAGGWAVLQSPSYGPAIYRVAETSEASRAEYTLSGKLTRLRLETTPDDANDIDAEFGNLTIRETTAFVQSERLDLADLPIVDLVEGDEVILDDAYLGLSIGQNVTLTGERADLDGVIETEVLTIADMVFSNGRTTLKFAQGLQNSYVRESVTINANVARATHGETVQETLGSGDASRPYQSFALLQSPLTYVSSAQPSGAQSTLEVRVGGLLWREVPSFFGQGPKDRVYVVRTDDALTSTVEFGDGINGPRPATGTENIQALYRKGGGQQGNVDAGALTLLPARPLGVRATANPLAASGATDPEAITDIRRNAPLGMMTLDRIVSLQDYQDFARAFQGVAKALATWSWTGLRRGVFVTVAGADGAALAESGQTYINLLSAMRVAGDPHTPLRVQSYRQAFFQIAATIVIAPDFETPTVLAAVESRLRAVFSFDARSFGQPVTLSEAIATIQSVAGVVAVETTQFFRTEDVDVNGLPRGDLPPALAAAAPEIGGDGTPLAAELLTLDPRPIGLVGASA